MDDSLNNLHADNMTSNNTELDSDILHAHASDNMQLDNMHSSDNVTSDNMASDSLDVTSDTINVTSDNMAQIEDGKNLYKGKLISVGRSMQTPSKIRVVPPIRIDMTKKKLIWVKRKLQMIKNK
ncbi:hypothetical protein TNCV_3096051 [Trichonephila clavipes]|nr:hypothetical protein TNCV_3096051 [Trichonephila clavipes]